MDNHDILSNYFPGNTEVTDYYTAENNQGLKHILIPIAIEEQYKNGATAYNISYTSISDFIESQENWNFPNPNFVFSLNNFFTIFDQYKCSKEELLGNGFNISLELKNVKEYYCFYDNE